MLTSIDCMPCFMRMAVAGARIAAPDRPDIHERIVRKWSAMLPELDFELCPPSVASMLNELVLTETGCGDVFAQDKVDSNRRVMEVLPDVKRLVDTSENPLATALEAAIIGNYIDRGLDHAFDWREELACLESSIDDTKVRDFANRCVDGASVVILGDNAGEIALDTLLVDRLKQLGCRVTYAVRSKPVLNDALLADARMVGMTERCEVVESGVDTPGTVLERCSPDFLYKMRRADVILSKGQGNFEALFDRWEDVFFAFKAKCERVAEETGRPLGCSVFMKR